MTPQIEKGYAVINRKWQAGDHIDLKFPLLVQRVTADPKVAADRGLEALVPVPSFTMSSGWTTLPSPIRSAARHWSPCGSRTSSTAS